MDLIKNNSDFAKTFDFQGAVLNGVTRETPNGALTGLELGDKQGNVLRLVYVAYHGIDVYTKQQVTKYKLHGDVNGVTIAQLFDDEREAQRKLEQFQRITEADHDAKVNLQVEEVTV